MHTMVSNAAYPFEISIDHVARVKITETFGDAEQLPEENEVMLVGEKGWTHKASQICMVVVLNVCIQISTRHPF